LNNRLTEYFFWIKQGLESSNETAKIFQLISGKSVSWHHLVVKWWKCCQAHQRRKLAQNFWKNRHKNKAIHFTGVKPDPPKSIQCDMSERITNIQETLGKMAEC
jgi:hypothetical protein